MDFSFSEEQNEIRALAARIMADRCTVASLKAFEGSGEPYDERVWTDLVEAGLTSLHLPEAAGGADLSFMEFAIVLEEVGRRVAPVPLWSHGTATWAVARFGDPGSVSAAVAAGQLWTIALHETRRDPLDPAAQLDSNNTHLSGRKDIVFDVPGASHVLVSARSGDRVALALVELSAAGVEIGPQVTPTGYRRAQVSFDKAPVAAVIELTAADFELVVHHALAGLCAWGVGALEESLRLTAAYATERHQFGKPIGTFQAVAQRAADAHIDTEAVRLTARHLAWRLAHGHPAAAEAAVAKYWLAEGGARVMLAAHHIHGGVGVDRDYPLPRYFFLVKELELTLGGATPHLLSLGDRIAAAALA